jgi:hypothetical protein
MKNFFLYAIVFFCLIACHSTGNGNDKSAPGGTVMSETRQEVQKQAVAVYDVPLKNDLNNWHFTVKLFETKQRFHYLADITYQEMNVSDTIRFPNFGIEPKPQIKKGTSDEECMIGFLDKEDRFREFVKVFVDNGQLRMKQVKQYAVYTK